MFAQKISCAALALCLAAPLVAGPTLTTIQDTIYLADGTPYNGLAIITWTPFVAGNTTQIATQVVNVTISGGNLMVQLVPSTNANPPGYYTVTYTSSGNDQFTQTWAVPPSTQPLTVQDVLFSTTTGGSIGTGSTGTSPVVTGTAPIPESNVTGLSADLAQRPLMGANYTPGRAAVIDSTGNLEGATGATSDCLHVDGSSGPCGSAAGPAGPTFIDGEMPAGVANGSNTAFTLSQVPTPATSLYLYRNGILQKPGQDYNLNQSSVQFVAASAPQSGDTLLAAYRVTPAGTAQGPPVPQVLCSATGTATSATTLTSLGTCTIAAGTLQPGDRVKISFDFSHEGTLTPFTFAVNWGNTVLVQRNGAIGDAFISGWAEGGANSNGTQLSVQSWGTVLGFAAAVMNGYDSLLYPIVLSFQGEMAATTTDTVTLRNFSVILYPQQ
jgi:hypothetical protein